MANTVIALKKSATPSAAPNSLANGEIAINYADGVFYYKNVAGYVATFTSGSVVDSFNTIDANGTAIVATTPNSIFSLIPGENIAITADTITNEITIAATSTISATDEVARAAAGAAFDKANTGGGGIGGGTQVTIGAYQINSSSILTTTTSSQTIDSFDKTVIRSANYIITMNVGSNYQTTQVVVMQDNYNAYLTEYGSIINSNILAIFTASIVSGIVELNANPLYQNTTFRIVRNALYDDIYYEPTSYTIGNSEGNSVVLITTTTNDQTIDSFDTNWISANYIITMNTGIKYQTTQLSVLQDGTNTYMTEYGSIISANTLGLFTSSINGGYVTLNVIPTFANTTIRMFRNIIK